MTKVSELMLNPTLYTQIMNLADDRVSGYLAWVFKGGSQNDDVLTMAFGQNTVQ